VNQRLLYRESGVKFAGVRPVCVVLGRRRWWQRRPGDRAIVVRQWSGGRRLKRGRGDAQLADETGGHQQRAPPAVDGDQPAKQDRVDERADSDPGRRHAERKTDQATAATVEVQSDDGDERYIAQAEPYTCTRGSRTNINFYRLT